MAKPNKHWSYSEFTADHGAVLDFIMDYAVKRGWRLRRLYLTIVEQASLTISTPHMTLSGECQFDGAIIRRVRSQEVANAIREWDLS